MEILIECPHCNYKGKTKIHEEERRRWRERIKRNRGYGSLSYVCPQCQTGNNQGKAA